MDYLFLPNIVNAQTRWMDNESHVCPWGQTLPYIIRKSPLFADVRSEQWLSPTLQFRLGLKAVQRGFRAIAGRLGVSRRRMNAAVEHAFRVQRRFKDQLESAGREALATLKETGRRGIVVIGRPYNIYDPGVSLSVVRKMREYYGVNVVPMDFISADDVDIRNIDENMYWDYGRRILATARTVGDSANLDIVYITNFKCGPDSFVKQFVRVASGKPFLTLQFDGHSNDAGVMTRCEAYLDSKGILRPWQQQEQQQPVSRAERSISRG